jgi:TonB-linked SusC/RagA family outer membrane protein
MCVDTNLFAQKKIIGTVISDDNVPLFGATVVLKNSNISMLTLSDGSFSVNANPGDVIEVSFIGFKTQQITIGPETNLKIVLPATVLTLDDVVLTGYTSQKIKEITGSVAVVKPKELISVPAGQAEQMLQGRVAGLSVITSGMPGGASNVRIHGIGNFGDVTPLYIIDGVQGNINNLNPGDIESLQVLKDAGAYAIYGVRGANGVIVITTRNGRPEKTKINYDFYISNTRPLKGSDLLNPQEMANVTWLALKNSGQLGSNGNPNDLLYGNGATPVLPDYFIAGVNQGLFANDPAVNPDLYNIDFTNPPIYQIVQTNKSGTDWFHELFKPVFGQNHSLTVSGANEKNKYLFSLGYLDQQGTMLNTYLKRYTVRINTTFSVNDHIRLGENLQLSYRDNPQIATQQGPNNNEVSGATTTQPILPVYDIKGGWAHFNAIDFNDNPVASRTLAKDNKTNYWEIFGNGFAEADFLSFFTARTSFGGALTNYYLYNFLFNSYNSTASGLPRNLLTESAGYRRSWTWTNTLTFSKTFNQHSLKVLAGTEAIDSYNRETGGVRAGFFTNDVNYRFLTNGSPDAQNNYSFAGASTLYSLITRADYGFKEKYFLTGTLRRDGSSIFGPGKKYGWFPSVSAAWRITEEKFLKPFAWLADLKFRGSWGKTGYYGNTDPFNQFTLYGGSVGDAYYDINGTSNSAVQGFRTVRIGDPNTGWQEDIVTNIGFESVFWNGKLSVTADWYNKRASGLLFPVTLPDILGGATPPNLNVGIIRNTGIDLLFGSKGKWSRHCGWDATLTVTTYHNKILKLNDLPYFIPSRDGAFFVRNQVGHPSGAFFGYKIIGIFNDDADVSKSPVQDAAAPGRFKYLDANHDNKIDDNDRVFFGDPNPKFTAGLNIGLNYKNFDFSSFCYGSFGNDVTNTQRVMLSFYQLAGAKNKAALYDSWTPQHTNAALPMAETGINFSNLGVVNSAGLEKGSYFRNKSLILGYTLPRYLLQKIKIEKLRIYIQSINLFTITKYKGLDPELSGYSDVFGIDFGNYPNNQKQYLLGISMNF